MVLTMSIHQIFNLGFSFFFISMFSSKANIKIHVLYQPHSSHMYVQ